MEFSTKASCGIERLRAARCGRRGRRSSADRRDDEGFRESRASRRPARCPRRPAVRTSVKASGAVRSASRSSVYVVPMPWSKRKPVRWLAAPRTAAGGRAAQAWPPASPAAMSRSMTRAFDQRKSRRPRPASPFHISRDRRLLQRARAPLIWASRLKISSFVLSAPRSFVGSPLKTRRHHSSTNRRVVVEGTYMPLVEQLPEIVAVPVHESAGAGPPISSSHSCKHGVAVLDHLVPPRIELAQIQVVENRCAVHHL